MSIKTQEGAEKTGLGLSSERYCKIYHIAVHILRSFISQLCWGGKDKFTEKGDARLLPKSIANLLTTTTATAAETKINKQIFAQF